jgi:hypothetical protein
MKSRSKKSGGNKVYGIVEKCEWISMRSK